MSHFRKSLHATGLGQVIDSLKQGVARNKATLFSKETARLMSAGLESAGTSSGINAFQANTKFLEEATLGQRFTAEGLESAAIVIGALGDPKQFIEAARNATPRANSKVFGQLAGGKAGSNQIHASLESFDTQEMSNHAQISIAYNLAAPRQDEFGEVLYPIIVATPDEAFFKVSVRRTTVWDGAVHTSDGDVTKFVKHNLLDAYRDSTILLNEATRLVPYATSAKAEYLAPDSIVADFDVKVGNVEVPTRPLVFGRKINLVGLAQHPELVAAGVMNNTDHIDRAMTIDKIWYRVTDGTAAPQYIAVDTARMQGNQFYKSTEGLGYEGMLRFRPKSIVLDGKVKDIAGANVAAFAAMEAAGISMTLSGTVDGDTNYEQGFVDVRAANLTVTRVVDANGVELSVTDAAVADLVIEPVYYTVNARLTNANRRVRGKMLDSDLWEEIYEVGLLAPLTIQFPVSNEKHDVLTVETLVEATHVQIAAAAVTSALNYAEHLDTFYRQNLHSLRAASIEGEGIEGIGRLLITPFYEEINVDLEKVVNSLTSADKLADIRGYFVGLINEASYRMAQQTGYIPAIRQYLQDPKAKPKLRIATDQILPSFMFLTGDTRVAGPSLDYEIGTTPNKQMEGTILLTFGGIEGDFCPLNFGNMIYVPELVSSIPMPRGGGLVMESTVQPRFRHVNNLPAMVKINVTGLNALIKLRTRLDANRYAV